MNDLLMRWLTARTVAAAAAVLTASLLLGPRLYRRALIVYHQVTTPSVDSDPSPLAPELDARIERRKQGELARRYRAVMARLDRAQAEGFRVDAHRLKARAALRLDQAGFRWKALEVLAQVEAATPRKKRRYLPLYPPQDEAGTVPPDVQPSRKRTRRGGSRRRR